MLPTSPGSSNVAVVTRREFTLKSALAILAGVVITVDGCGGDDSPTGPGPNPGPVGDVTGSISGNHGHTATIAAARITADQTFTLDITGQATHPHTVEVTQAELRNLAEPAGGYKIVDEQRRPYALRDLYTRVNPGCDVNQCCESRGGAISDSPVALSRCPSCL